MQSSTLSPVNRGMSVASMSVVMAIVLIAAPLGYMRYAEYMNERTWDVMALHMDTVTRAARHYVRDNYAALQSQVNGGHPVTVSGQTLRDKGYLPSGFSLTNFSTQRYLVGIARDPQKTSQMAAFVMTTGGQPIAFKGLRYVSQSVSGMGGYLYPDNIANGADGGWQLKLADYGLSGQSGHLVNWLSADVLDGSNNDESDRLYRFQVNGRPDLNRMHTDIDMGSNAVSNASTVTASGDIKTSGGWIVTHDSKGWMNETHGGGLYMDDDNWLKSVNNKGISTGGQLKGGSVRADGRLSTGEVLQLDKVNIAGDTCDTNGLMSRDSTGSPLSCINHIWTTPGNGWKIPRPQTVSCTIRHRGGPYSYTDLFEAKVDSNGNVWTHFRADSGVIDSGWIRGEYVNTTRNQYMPTVATVSISGLVGQEPITTCAVFSHSETHCGEPVLNTCYAGWKY
ncbi:shufflon system plasmid conjugative transfer pilus tip adhesin PilV [Enterobacter asburiae]|uniref:shufflon system plasmid conjugative transfer pilus tip adhesin PilV n=1 Tax=Enterobacter asburiae TaxID=61645 RepID=UPI003F563338